MTDDLPPPPIPADADLKDFPFMPLYRARLFGSEFHSHSSDGEWRAGITLWLKSWDQVPAGSLPDNEVDLCRLAELGRDLKEWKKVEKGALHGWQKCSDGRLYHPVVAESVLEAWAGKLKQRYNTECARIKKHNQRNPDSDPLAVPTFDEWMAARQPQFMKSLSSIIPPAVQPMSLRTDQGQNEIVPQVSRSKGKGKGKGEGKIQGVVGDTREALDRLQAELFEAGGDILDPTSIALMDLSRPLAWLGNGCDLELDILPTIRTVTSHGLPRTIRNWKYFERAVADARARRCAPMPQGNPNEQQPPRSKSGGNAANVSSELESLSHTSGIRGEGRLGE